MKLFLPTTLLFLGISLSAQMPGMMTVQSGSQGTALGANDTISASGIALGNAVKLRGFVDFRLQRIDAGNTTMDTTTVSSDADFLINFSPVTAEVHLNLEEGGGDLLEQAFGRYSFFNEFHLTFGRQVSSLGFESDEPTDLYSVTRSYRGDAERNPGRHYLEGVRLNFNNGQFGFVLGLYDGYHTNGEDDLDNGLAIDIAASVMIVPGLEARLGFANDNGGLNGDDEQQVNGWVAWNPNALTLALEFDHFDFGGDSDAWDLMLLANYQFSDLFGATLRYAHMDAEIGGADDESDRITLALLFSITEHFGLNLEYSHTANDGDDDNEFYLQGLITY
jgi:hypothetical protein